MILVTGAGFAGLKTIQALRREGCLVPITLLAPHLETFYFPALIWAPAGLYQLGDLQFSLEKFIKRYNVNYLAGHIIGLDAKNQCLKTNFGEIEYEKLIIATGGETSKKFLGLEHVCIPDRYVAVASMMQKLAELKSGTISFGFSKNADDSSATRSEVLLEFLFGIDTLLRRQGRRKNFKIQLFSDAFSLATRGGNQTALFIQKEIDRRNIQFFLGRKIIAFEKDKIHMEDGDLKSDLTVFLPELIGPSWESDLSLSKTRFIHADINYRAKGFEKTVYVAGDVGCFPGPDWESKQAHMADIHSQTVAKNLVADLLGKEATHTFRREFICILDTLDSGILMFQNESKCFAFQNKMLHWAKRLFVWTYLLQRRLQI
ncbi:Sulfide-quinone reductase [Gammaproteobacteria bacterium]